jgi:copper(I)-binding protein
MRIGAGARTAIGLFLILVVFVLLVGGCSGGDSEAEADTGNLGEVAAETDSLAIYEPFIPAPPADIAALYFAMVDRDGEGDRLLGVTAEAAAMTHLHSTVTEGDSSRMVPVEGGIVLPPNGMTALEPGGLHVMLMNLENPLVDGDTITVTLQFERAGAVTIEVPVVTYSEAESDDD